MKLLLFSVLIAFVVVAQVFCGEPKEEADYWTNSNQMQDDWLANDPFREILLRMTRKPRPHQFIGLMGKRSMGNAQITHKRHKVNSFVGLMGKKEPRGARFLRMEHITDIQQAPLIHHLLCRFSSQRSSSPGGGAPTLVLFLSTCV